MEFVKLEIFYYTSSRRYFLVAQYFSSTKINCDVLDVAGLYPTYCFPFFFTANENNNFEVASLGSGTNNCQVDAKSNTSHTLQRLI